MWIKDALRQHRYINSNELRYIEAVKVEGDEVRSAYWSIVGMMRDRSDTVRLKKVRYEKQAVEELNILIAKLNREAYKDEGKRLQVESEDV